jgi:hypothetical protein
MNGGIGMNKLVDGADVFAFSMLLVDGTTISRVVDEFNYEFKFMNPAMNEYKFVIKIATKGDMVLDEVHRVMEYKRVLVQ